MARQAEAAKPVRHRTDGLQTRAEIIAAAERQFAEHGFEATRLEDVATQVGIRRAAIFHYFGDKQELYAAVLEELFGAWSEGLPAGGTPTELLESALTGWIDFVARRPTVARLVLREAASSQPGHVSPFMQAGSISVEWFRTLIDEGVASGELAPKIEPYRFMSLMGAITVFHFASMPWLTLKTPVDPWSQTEIDQHKREILLVARAMLGVREKHET